MKINGYEIKPSADLQGADLQGANLQGANLQGAFLQRANLQGAFLQRANLRDADLQGAYLQRADLQGAYLQGAYLQGAFLQGAYLQRAFLQGAYLQGAFLQRAYLQGANLRGADLRDADLPPLSILPEGVILGWKKLREGICKLEIPAVAKRVNSTGRKCRAEFARVLMLPAGIEVGHAQHDQQFTYRVGEIVKPDKYDPDFRVECSHGIHFFITREEAENYRY